MKGSYGAFICSGFFGHQEMVLAKRDLRGRHIILNLIFRENCLVCVTLSLPVEKFWRQIVLNAADLNGTPAVVQHVWVRCLVVVSEFRWRTLRHNPDYVCLHVPMFLHHEWGLLGINGSILRKDVTFL
jgi:hypothetical protein